MLKKAFDDLPIAIFLGSGIYILTLFVFEPKTIGGPVLQYTNSIPAFLLNDYSLPLNIFSWIFLVSIFLVSFDRIANSKKVLKTTKQKISHGLAVGINSAFIAGSFLLYQTGWSINLALIIIYLVSLIILFQDGLLAGTSATITSSLVLFALYLSLVLGALVGAIIAITLIAIGYLLIRFSKK